MMEEYERYDAGALLKDRYKKVADISEGSYGLVSVAKDTHKEDLLVAVKFIYPVDYKKNDPHTSDTSKARPKVDSQRATSSPAKLRSNIPTSSSHAALDVANVSKANHSPARVLQCKADVLKALYEEAAKEIKIHQILQHHTNIVTLYDHFDSCLVLEYCARGDLYEAIQNGMSPSSSRDIKEVFFQILNALEYSHSHNVFHRDLKPENILISEDWSIKLCDWGLATTTRTITNKGEFDIGSERYMAPELFDSESESYDAAKIDLWSVGIILLTLVFHKNPFQVANYSDKRFLQFAANREALFDIFSTMSGEMFSVLRFCLNIDPSNRDMQSLKDELSSLKYFTYDEEDWASDYDYDEDEEVGHNYPEDADDHFHTAHPYNTHDEDFDFDMNQGSADDDEFQFNSGTDTSSSKKGTDEEDDEEDEEEDNDDQDEGDKDVTPLVEDSITAQSGLSTNTIQSDQIEPADPLSTQRKYVPPKAHSPLPPVITTTDTSEFEDDISHIKDAKIKRSRPKSVSHIGGPHPRADFLLDTNNPETNHGDELSNDKMPHNHRADALLSSSTDMKPIPINNGGLKFIRNTRKPFNVPSYSHSRKINGGQSHNHYNRDKFAREDFFTPKSMFTHYMDKYGESKNNRSNSFRANGSNRYNQGNNYNSRSNYSNGRQQRSDWKRNGRKRQSWKYKNNNAYNNNHNNNNNYGTSGNSHHHSHHNSTHGYNNHKNSHNNTTRSSSQHQKGHSRTMRHNRSNNEFINPCQKKKGSSSFTSSKSRKTLMQNALGTSLGSAHPPSSAGVSASITYGNGHVNPLTASFHELNHPSNTASHHGSPGTSGANTNGKYIPPYLRSPNYARSPVIEAVTEEIDNLTLDNGNDESTIVDDEVFHLEEDFDLAFNHNNSNETNKSLSSVNTNSTSVNSATFGNESKKSTPSFKIPTYSISSLTNELVKGGAVAPGTASGVSTNLASSINTANGGLPTTNTNCQTNGVGFMVNSACATQHGTKGRRHSINKISDIQSTLASSGVSSSPGGKYIPPFRRGSHSAVSGGPGTGHPYSLYGTNAMIKGRTAVGDKRRSGHDYYDKIAEFAPHREHDEDDGNHREHGLDDGHKRHDKHDFANDDDGFGFGYDGDDDVDDGFMGNFRDHHAHRHFLSDGNANNTGMTSSSVPSSKTDWFPVKKNWIDYDE